MPYKILEDEATADVAFEATGKTLDELFEALTLVQTGKIARMPIILVGKKYWQDLIKFDYMVEEGVIESEDVNLFEYVETAQDAWEKIRVFYEGSK